MLQQVKVSRLTYVLCATFFFAVYCSKVKELPTNFDDPRIGSEKGAIHIVTNTECNEGYLTYQDWALKYSLEMVNQPGKFTRIMSCDHPEEVTEEDLSYMDTMIVPDWSIHPTIGEDYAPYNRPSGLIYWLEGRKPTAEWTMIVDPDMLFFQALSLEDLDIPAGYALAGRYEYLKGVYNELADIHIPHIPRRNDSYGGTEGRKADVAGAFYLIRTKDLAKVAPLWMKYTEDLRKDPRTINYTGTEEQAGEKEWVSEMYGYSFAAAVSGVWHKLDATIITYPGLELLDIPVVIHYGLSNILGSFYFDKHFHRKFDVTRCPPWNMDLQREEEDDGGLFPHPPFPDFVMDTQPGLKYGNLLVIHTVNTINQALCTRHRRQCPPSVQLEKECGRVDAIAKAVKVEFDKLHVPGVICKDSYDTCKSAVERGECESNWRFTNNYCRGSCKRCRSYRPRSGDTIVAQNEVQLNKTEALNQRIQSLKNEISDSTEVSRCQSLSLKAFMVDSSCAQLVRDGIISLDGAQMDQVSFERSTILLRGTESLGVYSAVMLAVGFIGLMLLFRRYSIVYRKKMPVRYK